MLAYRNCVGVELHVDQLLAVEVLYPIHHLLKDSGNLILKLQEGGIFIHLQAPHVIHVDKGRNDSIGMVDA